jgi:hypothetical protein
VFLFDTAGRIRHELDVQSPRQTPVNLALSFSEVSPIGLESISPNVSPGFAIDQLHIDLRPVAGPPDTAFKNVADAQIIGDLLRINGLTLVAKGSVARDHETVGDPRQIGRQIIGNAVDEIFLLRVIRQVRERQNHD